MSRLIGQIFAVDRGGVFNALVKVNP